ncbi:ZINC FINGER CCCH DOMAIN-CONTAINING PROTEIN 45-RELATED [Salix viminalis]|uniref:ZINC FINGER CCCH DOMAIN-CONTAINING PROTEIN 45-RELATED n=1 Tax=Salix viminalis TaxID=40686 RepID=A0A9Q0NZD9_SALVM|nr:ZINC FINGER CCCH DOMAIN-CONTAINING PROTEIN 45-RELATED [Salix viminalis]
MKRSRKSGRVSWAPALNLCQVRLFLSEDCPSEVGGQVLDHLQKNVLRLLPISSSKDSNDLPPGFQGTRVLNPYIKELSNIHRVQWKCPPSFVVNYDWRVTVGEESQESEAQKLREMRVLEAVYPRPSSVPPSPAVSLDVEEEIYDDSLTPIIPLIPVEEEEAAEMPAALTEPLKNPTTSLSQALPSALLSSGIVNSSNCNTTALNPPANQNPELGRLPDPGTHPITSASAAVTAIMKSKEQGGCIDTDLLVKFFGGPKMVDKLISGNQTPPVTSRPVSSSRSPLCAKPAMVSAPSPANGISQHLPSEELPWSNPVGQIPITGPKPAVHFPSMAYNGSLHYQLSQAQTTTSRTSVHQDGVPATGLEVASPIPVPIQDPARASSAKTPQISYFTDNHPSPMFDLVNSTLVKQPKQPIGAPQAGMKTNLVKDVSYIKNLIKEHGTVKKEMKDRSLFHGGNHYYNHYRNPESTQNSRNRELKPKFQKPCMYFKTPKGCRNGSDCHFQHDMSFQFQAGSGDPELQVAKRMRFSGEITAGRT